MNKKSRRRRELRAHLEKWIDRAQFPNYVLTDDDLSAYIKHESAGVGSKPPALSWVKACEEITIKMMWQEMADSWMNGWGWCPPLMHTIECEYRERNGSNIWLRKLLTIARGIKAKGFLEALLKYTGFSRNERNRYLSIKFPPANTKHPHA